VTIEIEANSSCNLAFERLERVTVALNVGNGVDIDV
jgi:hypothetical protein